MVQPNELRIGNWVKWPKEKEPNEAEWSHGHWLGVFEKNYPFPEPIPLTVSWLNRIDWRGYKDLYFNSYFCLDESFHLYYRGDYTGINVNYVHQLQNLYYSLTGTELELIK